MSFFIETNIIKLYQGISTNNKHKTLRTKTTKDKGQMIDKNDDLFYKLEVGESILGRIKVLHDEKIEKWQNPQNEIKIKIGVYYSLNVCVSCLVSLVPRCGVSKNEKFVVIRNISSKCCPCRPQTFAE